MFVDLTKPIKHFNGEPIMEAGDKPMTLASAISSALVRPEQGISGKEQLDRFLLATRIHDASLPVELSVEEAALVKKCVASGCGPLITGPVWLAIEAAPAPPAPAPETKQHANGADKHAAAAA